MEVTGGPAPPPPCWGVRPPAPPFRSRAACLFMPSSTRFSFSRAPTMTVRGWTRVTRGCAFGPRRPVPASPGRRSCPCGLHADTAAPHPVPKPLQTIPAPAFQLPLTRSRPCSGNSPGDIGGHPALDEKRCRCDSPPNCPAGSRTGQRRRLRCSRRSHVWTQTPHPPPPPDAAEALDVFLARRTEPRFKGCGFTVGGRWGAVRRAVTWTHL